MSSFRRQSKIKIAPRLIPDLVETTRLTPQSLQIDERNYSRQQEATSVSLPPVIKIDSASLEDPNIDNLPKEMSEMHLRAPPPLGPAAADDVEASTSTSSATSTAAVDASAPRKAEMKKKPRARAAPKPVPGQFSLKTSPEDPQVLPVWYLKTHYDDLFLASAHFQALRARLAPLVFNNSFTRVYDVQCLARYKRKSEPSADQSCCCSHAVAEALQCKRCWKMIERCRRDSLDSHPRIQAPEHPRALYSVRPSGPSSRNSPVVTLSITPRRARRTSLGSRSDEPRYRYRSQSCCF